jgi:response regulator RpfG family c-di-GMP phosphodiesterase
MGWHGHPTTGLVLVRARADDPELLRRAINEARVHLVVLKPWEAEAMLGRLRALLKEQAEMARRLRAFARAAAEAAEVRPEASAAPDAWPPS